MCELFFIILQMSADVFSNLDPTGIPDPRRCVDNEASASDDDDESPGGHQSYQNDKQEKAESDDDDVRAVPEGSDTEDSDDVEEDCNREPSVQILKQKSPDIDETTEMLRKQKLDDESRQPRTQVLELPPNPTKVDGADAELPPPAQPPNPPPIVAAPPPPPLNGVRDEALRKLRVSTNF
jgi:hypothetical protein